MMTGFVLCEHASSQTHQETRNWRCCPKTSDARGRGREGGSWGVTGGKQKQKWYREQKDATEKKKERSEEDRRRRAADDGDGDADADADEDDGWSRDSGSSPSGRR